MRPTLAKAATVLACALGAALGASAPAAAHHSGAMFDQQKEVVLSGVVKEFQFTAPHSWLQVLVPNPQGGMTEWSFEAGATTALLRAGIKAGSFKAGEKVSVKSHPLKDGRAGGSLVSVTKADGTVLEAHPKAEAAS